MYLGSKLSYLYSTYDASVKTQSHTTTVEISQKAIKFAACLFDTLSKRHLGMKPIILHTYHPKYHPSGNAKSKISYEFSYDKHRQILIDVEFHKLIESNFT